MSYTDLIQMVGNISRSLSSVQHLLYGFAYLLGIIFCIKAIRKFQIVASRTGSFSANEGTFAPTAYLISGAAMLFLPSMLDIMANTAFGSGNIIAYSSYNPYDIRSSMGFIIQTAGIMWFLRGCVLIAHAGDPSAKSGLKGLMFLMAGIFAMNFDNTISYVDWALAKLISYTL